MNTEQTEEAELKPGLLLALVRTRRIETEKRIFKLIEHGEDENVNVLEGHLHDLKEQEEILEEMADSQDEIIS